jgi:hypothetical protein
VKVISDAFPRKPLVTFCPLVLSGGKPYGKASPRTRWEGAVVVGAGVVEAGTGVIYAADHLATDLAPSEGGRVEGITLDDPKEVRALRR